MASIEFYSHGKLHRINARTQEQFQSSRSSRSAKARAASIAPKALNALHLQAERVAPLLHSVSESTTLVSIPKGDGPVVIPTATLMLGGATKAEVKKIKSEFGLEVAEEGLEGKVLLRAPEAGEEGAKIAAAAAKKAYESGNFRAAHPNFLRVFQHIERSAPGASAPGLSPMWNHTNDGNPGVVGADVATLAAWTITKGHADVRVAVLDEGVDAAHPALSAAVVADKDFVDGHDTSVPDGNDAHGTACAGIVLSRDSSKPGLAPACSLVGVRIAKGDGLGGWVFDDFKTADAIDWAWKTGKADVLSNSWGGGPPVDSITNAFERARTKGRGGKGSVIVAATGNRDVQGVDYPARLENVLAVGASNPWDERKSKTTADGETRWGSNYGPEIDLLAPGVRIATTDIRGASGYTAGNFVDWFNGTSSATPHVAAAAALLITVNPKLTEQQVRGILTASAFRLSATGKWDKFVGWGRLDVFQALRLARR